MILRRSVIINSKKTAFWKASSIFFKKNTIKVVKSLLGALVTIDTLVIVKKKVRQLDLTINVKIQVYNVEEELNLTLNWNLFNCVLIF